MHDTRIEVLFEKLDLLDRAIRGDGLEPGLTHKIDALSNKVDSLQVGDNKRADRAEKLAVGAALAALAALFKGTWDFFAHRGH